MLGESVGDYAGCISEPFFLNPLIKVPADIDNKFSFARDLDNRMRLSEFFFRLPPLDFPRRRPGIERIFRKLLSWTSLQYLQITVGIGIPRFRCREMRQSGNSADDNSKMRLTGVVCQNKARLFPFRSRINFIVGRKRFKIGNYGE
jgi:hypothetical protein